MGVAAYNRGSRALADQIWRDIEASRATITDRADLWKRVLEAGAILHFRCNNGDVVTCGPHIVAVGEPRFSAYRDGNGSRSRWKGDHIGSAWSVALWVVEHVGRRRPYRVAS